MGTHWRTPPSPDWRIDTYILKPDRLRKSSRSLDFAPVDSYGDVVLGIWDLCGIDEVHSLPVGGYRRLTQLDVREVFTLTKFPTSTLLQS